MILIQEGAIAIRPMQDVLSDYQLMAKWLTDEQVLAFYEGRDNPFPLERVRLEYQPKDLKQERIYPCFFLYKGIEIGYLQYYPLTEADQQNYGGYGIGEDGTFYAIDLFIGEPRFWNQGIGTQVVSLTLKYLFKHKQAHKVLIDPHVTNLRAIRCYEKAGFSKIKILPQHELHEGEYRDAWLMVASA